MQAAKIYKKELNLAVRRVYMPKNRYAMSYAILTFRADFVVCVNLLLCEECLYFKLFFSVTHIAS